MYKARFQELRDLKKEIERIQKHLEKMRLKMQNDFESWYVGLHSGERHAEGGWGDDCHPALLLLIAFIDIVSRPHAFGFSLLLLLLLLLLLKTLVGSFRHAVMLREGGTSDAGSAGGPFDQKQADFDHHGGGPAPAAARQAWRGRSAEGEDRQREQQQQQHHHHHHHDHQPPVPVALTGDSEADADILAFYKAKAELLQRSGGGGGT